MAVATYLIYRYESGIDFFHQLSARHVNIAQNHESKFASRGFTMCAAYEKQGKREETSGGETEEGFLSQTDVQ